MIKTKKLLILGNGFDLDLGLNTRYSDFIQSPYWNFQYDSSPLIQFIKQTTVIHSWFDLETLLKVYSQPKNASGYVNIIAPNGHIINRIAPSNSDKDKDEQGYNELVSKMTEFINNEEINANLETESYAARLFGAVVKNNGFESIYTFNYTDLNKLAALLNLQEPNSVVSVHGSIATGPILGIEDTADVRPGYSFLYKTFNANYRSNHLKYDLDEAKVVYFFGHSLGSADYHYFETFFRNQCNPDMTEGNKVKIVFITYDDESRRNMLEQLREMNRKRTDYLFSLNDLEIICTSKENDKIRFNQLVKDIEDDIDDSSFYGNLLE